MKDNYRTISPIAIELNRAAPITDVLEAFSLMLVKSRTMTTILAASALVPLLFFSGSFEALAATLTGTSGDDYIEGTSDDDFITGGDGGNNFLYGKAGNDDIYGGPNADVVGGDSGNDRLWGGPGSDRVYGGYGNDYINADGESSVKYWVGGPDNDEMIYGGNSAPSGGVILMYGNDGDDRLEQWDYVFSEEDKMREVIMSGGNGDDYLITHNNAIMWGDAGNDVMYAYDSTAIYGGGDNDEMHGSVHPDFISGGDGDDEIWGGEGADMFSCGAGFDIIHDFDASEGDVELGDCESLNS